VSSGENALRTILLMPVALECARRNHF
jgi:hypothetical protein